MRRRLIYSAPALLAAVFMAGCAGTGTLDPSVGNTPGPSSSHSSGPAVGGGHADKTDKHAPTTSPTTPSSTESPDKPAPSDSPTATKSPSNSQENSQENSATKSDDSKSDESKHDNSDKSDSSSTQKSDAKTTEKTDQAADKQLRYGDSGPAVKALQERLKSLGYWVSGTDGRFGPTTQQAVFAIQKVAGLGRDGVVGQKTRAAIDRGAMPSAKSTSGHVVEVDRARQIVMIVNNGRVTTVLNTSTGSGRYYTSEGQRRLASTPAGQFTVSRQIDGPRQSKLGYLWRPKYFNGGIALHGEHNNVPAYAASHGCVRVTDAAMNWIWDTNKVPIGTKVWVY